MTLPPSAKRWAASLAIAIVLINNLEGLVPTLSWNKVIVIAILTVFINYFEIFRNLVSEFK